MVVARPTVGKMGEYEAEQARLLKLFDECTSDDEIPSEEEYHSDEELTQIRSDSEPDSEHEVMNESSSDEDLTSRQLRVQAEIQLSSNERIGTDNEEMQTEIFHSVELTDVESASYPGSSGSKEINLHVLKPALSSPVNLKENTHLLNVLASEVTSGDNSSSGSSNLWEPSDSEREHGKADSEDP
ncbi:unnamed protein product [Diabrotica balteata]|uniref:Uncharacterized protein n=1 Tax=Diabrotica balteata TaxID=107213 RepID=A0A9N9X6J3_DIABA|nr:unnamed protein product [Diabrotica balteata]